MNAPTEQHRGPAGRARAPTPTEGGRMLAKALEARGLSWAEASRQLGKHPTWVRKLIVGERSPATYALRVALRRAFGVPPAAWDRKPRGPIARRPPGPVPGQA